MPRMQNLFRANRPLTHTGVLPMTETAMNPKESYQRVFQELQQHHEWFNSSIPLIASENLPSLAVREAILSDFGNRYAEGWPGERVYAGCTYIDRVELLCTELARQLFKAEFADVRPISGVCANLSIYTAFSSPGDRILALSIPSGGHISTGKAEFGGTAGAVRGLNVEYFPFDVENMNIDVDKTKQKVAELTRETTPKLTLAMFGGSVLLFPQPLKELTEFLRDHQIAVCFDAAHVLGLIAGGRFQDPLREGVDVVSASTHKTLPGPQGGIILSWTRHADKIKRSVFPGNLSNHHLHHVAGKAIAFAEMLAFGREYAEQIVKNARALAEGLSKRGLKVLGESHGFTRTHIVIADVSKYGNGKEIEKKLEQSNIILNRNLLPYDIKMGRHFETPGGIRCGTSECTRLGMKETDMDEIADLIAEIVIKGSIPERVRERVKEFRKDFTKIGFCFESESEAYKYITIRSN